jgi:hypothetical protein
MAAATSEDAKTFRDIVGWLMEGPHRGAMGVESEWVVRWEPGFEDGAHPARSG